MYFVGLLILTVTAIPSAIASGSAFPGYVVAIIIIGMGTGGIKANVSPLVAEQYQDKKPYVKTTKKGERVIVSPQATYQRIFNMFYWVSRSLLDSNFHYDSCIFFRRPLMLEVYQPLQPQKWKRTLVFGLLSSCQHACLFLVF